LSAGPYDFFHFEELIPRYRSRTLSLFFKKVKEVKSEWEKQSRLRILLGIAVAAGFAVLFFFVGITGVL